MPWTDDQPTLPRPPAPPRPDPLIWPTTPTQPRLARKAAPARPAFASYAIGFTSAAGIVALALLLIVNVVPWSHARGAFATSTPPAVPGRVSPGGGVAASTAPPSTSVPLPPDRIPFLCDPTPTPTDQPCTPCPYNYRPQAAPLGDVKLALNQAADAYQLPRPLVYAIAASESSWRLDNQVTCSFDIGIMQLKKGYWRSVDLLDAPACGLPVTQYDPYELVGGAMLGAKQLKWLSCYFAFMSGTGTSDQPAVSTAAWYYQQAGLAFPDPHLCALHDHEPAYQALQAAPGSIWGCPFDATPNAPTLLDLVIAAYNSGVGAIAQASAIPNQGYVDWTKHWIVYFQTNAYP